MVAAMEIWEEKTDTGDCRAGSGSLIVELDQGIYNILKYFLKEEKKYKKNIVCGIFLLLKFI